MPEPFHFNIDYDAIARDLAIKYSGIEIAGERLIYRAC
ncbi:antirestriction protein ArdA [Ruegeria litorea]|nr:antirestriction protein ArdA [Falsiruegeria litorea]